MNILMLATKNNASGVTSCIASLSHGLTRLKNANVTIAVGGGKNVFLNDLNVEVIDFSSKSLFSIIRNYRKMVDVINKYDIDIIHAHNRIPALYAAFYCFFHRRMKYIWSNHLVPLNSGFIWRIITRYGSCAVAEGLSGKKMLIEDFHIPENKTCVINLGTDLSKFHRTSLEQQAELRARYNINSDEKVLLLYGRLVPVKGHLFLLDALKNLHDENFRLIIPGEDTIMPDGKSYKQMIIEKSEEYGLKEKLIFPGFINGKEWLSISDLMVLPSASEGFGVVNIESFCCEVPVIRTTTGGYEDMADCCFGINYGDVDTLSTLLGKFFKGDVIFEEKKHYAKENAVRFGLDVMTNKYYSLYTSIINGNNYAEKI